MNIDDIKAIIEKDENRVLELKKTTGELIKGMQTLCAFLNSDGGWLFFGITPKLEVLGQNVTDSTQSEKIFYILTFSLLFDKDNKKGPYTKSLIISFHFFQMIQLLKEKELTFRNQFPSGPDHPCAELSPRERISHLPERTSHVIDDVLLQ